MIVTCGKVDRMNFEGYYLGDEINTMIESKKKLSRPDVYLDHDPSDQTTMNYLKQQGQGKAKIQRCFVGNINGIIAAVDAGLGRAVMPRHLIKNQKNIRPLDGQKEMITPVYLYVLKQPFYSKLHEGVMKELKEKLHAFLE